MNVPCEFRSRRVAVCGHADAGREGRGVRRAPPWRAVRDPQPVGRRLGPPARPARLPGARDDELGLRLHPRPPRRRRDPRRRGRARRARRRRHGAAGLGRPRERVRSPRRLRPPARSRRSPRRAPSAGRSRTGTRPGTSTSRPRPRSGSPRPPRPRARWRSRSCSPGVRRTTSAATPTSTTRSRACRRTRRRAPTCSTRRGSGRWTRSAPSAPRSAGRSTSSRARPGLRRAGRGRRPAGQRRRGARLDGGERARRRGDRDPRSRRLLAARRFARSGL